jgi:hypothetical protein
MGVIICKGLPEEKMIDLAFNDQEPHCMGSADQIGQYPRGYRDFCHPILIPL